VVEIEAFNISPADICIGIGYGITVFFFVLSYNLMLAFCITAALTLWLAVNDFYNQSVLLLESSLHPRESGDGHKEQKPTNIVYQKCARDQEKLFATLLESTTRTFSMLHFQNHLLLCNQSKPNIC